MPTEQIYKTKQRQIILDYLAHVRRQHITAAEICEHFRKCKIQISPATVYRHLEKFISDGIVRKYYMDGIPGACFQYIGICEDCESHIHFKCVECGCLICVECEKLDDLRAHFSHEHGFQIDSAKTVFYGKCPDCLKKEGNNDK